ncbi:MAG: DUF3857 domain-containing protein [Candidatus Acidiferrales bacterium]
MTLRRFALCCVLAPVLALAGRVPLHAKLGDPWLPIDPYDLAMTSEPLAPGAPAIYLYREIAQDDTQGYADYYYRVKILTDEGKKLGNVEIPYNSRTSNVTNVSGRTIHPDGTISVWQGKPLDQTVVRAHGVKVVEKTFSMPDVQTGSIIEYKYRVGWDKDNLYRTTWFVTGDLFTRKLNLTLTPYADAYILYQWERLGQGAAPTRAADGTISYTGSNVPGVEKEDFRPPDDVIEGKIDFYYADAPNKDAAKYWKAIGKSWNDEVDKFVGHNSAIRDEAGKVAPASDSPETRLRKLYARAQQVRNLSYGPEKTAVEIKAEKLKSDNNAEDVLKNGYGYVTDVNLFFVALARAAGFDASSVRVSERADFFFNQRILDARQLEYADVVLVTLNGQNIFLDPAAAHCAFGELTWEETGVVGLKLDGSGGTFITTTPSKSSDAIIERTATLQMSGDAMLQGTLVVTFSGQYAMDRRQAADLQDDVDRAKTLTDEVTSWLAVGATAKLTNQPDWAGSDTPLRAEFDVRMRAVGANAGHLVLISENFFSEALPQFDHPLRTYPIYFDHPWEYHDDVTLTLPLLLQAGDLPAPVDKSSPFGVYKLSCVNQSGALHFQRVTTLNGIYYDVQYYESLRAFFDEARHADQQQVMLHVAGAQGAQARQ